MTSCQIEVISLLSRRSIFFCCFWDKCRLIEAFLRQTRGEGSLLLTNPVHSNELKKTYKSSCYFTICSLFWSLDTISIAFASVNVYTLKFRKKNNFFIFFYFFPYWSAFDSEKWVVTPSFIFHWISIALGMIYIVIFWKKKKKTSYYWAPSLKGRLIDSVVHYPAEL